MFPSNPTINDLHVEQNKTFVYNGEGWVLQSDLVLPDGSKWEDSGLTQIIPKSAKHIPASIIDDLPEGGLIDIIKVNTVVQPIVDKSVDLTINGSTTPTASVINVVGTTQGAYSDGNTIAAGTALETIVRNMLTTVINPTYTAPTSSITNVSNSYELGTSVSISITQTFTQNDAGAIVSQVINKDGVQASVTSTFAETLTVDDSTTYSGTVTYAEGPIKNNNIGTPYPTGHILGGTVTSATRTITGYRKMFYGVSLPATTSAEIRLLGNSLNNPANNSTAALTIPIGATSVTFAYPKSLGVVLSIKDALNIDVQAAFARTEVAVTGANLYTAVDYYVYRYVPASPFAQSNTYTITI